MRTLHTCELLYSPELDAPGVDYAVLVDDKGEEAGTILAVGPAGALRDEGDRRITHQILMPGVVNAHIHLTDAGRRERVPGGEGLVSWIQTLMRTRTGGLTPDERGQAVRDTLDEMRRSGTVAVGEVVNDARTLPAIQASGMECLLIHELIAFRHDRIDGILAAADRLLEENLWNEGVRHALGAHAPYSVAPELMTRMAERSRAAGSRFYQHLAEDPAERELYETGGGSWREFLEAVGAWEPDWRPPGLAPIPYYDRLGVLDGNFTAVHLADADAEELVLLGRRGVRAILSPRSNLHITGLFPDVPAMIAAGIPLAFGTDGRGSSPGMDVFDEAAVVSERFPDLPAGVLLRALTEGGGLALGFDHLGKLLPGTRPGLVSVRTEEPVSSDLRDLERAALLRSQLRERIV